MSERFDLTTTAPTLAARRPSVTAQRYSPWTLGAYFSFSLAAPILSAALGFLIIEAAGYGGWGWLLCSVPLPFSAVLFVWTWRAAAVELERLNVEWDELHPDVSSAGNSPAEPPAPTHLRLGILQNGAWVSPAENMHPELLALQRKCLRLVRAGMKAENWSRSALAEGEGRVMEGGDWDDASRELQHLDLFTVSKGKGGGLRPNPARDLAETIKRLEVAR